ncbi:MAG: flippase [Halorientalis sp.]
MSDDAGESLSRILSGSAITFVGSFLNKLISFGGSVFMARLLGDSGYGVVAVALSVYFVTANIATLGIGNGIARNYPQKGTDAERRGVLVSAFRIGLVSSLLLGGLVFFLARPIAVGLFGDRAVTPVLRIMALVIPLKVLLNYSNSCFQAVKRATPKSVITSIVFPIVRICLIVVLVLAGYAAVGVAGAWVAATGVAAALSLYLVHRYTDLFSLGRPWTVQYRELLVFSLPLIGSSVIYRLMNNADTLLIGSLASSADVGQYNVAFILSQATLLFFQTLGFMWVPEISELYANDRTDRAQTIFRAVTKWVVFLSVPFTLTAIAFPEFVVTFIYSAEYRAAAVPFLILMVGFLTHVLVGPVKHTLVACGSTREIFLVDAATLVVNLALNLTLIPLYGIAGAAVATSFAYVARNAGMTWYLDHRYGIFPFSRHLFLPLIPTAIAAVALWALVPAPSLPLVLGYAAALVGVVTLGYLSSGIEEADLLLAELLEEQTGVDLDRIRWVHDRLR